MRNYALEQQIIELLDSYRKKLLPSCRSWTAVAASVDLSRNAVYDIINSEEDVKRDTVVLLGLALEMSLDDFLILYNYKGFVFRKGIYRDEITCRFFKKALYDHEEWGRRLIEGGEEPPFNYNKPIK